MWRDKDVLLSAGLGRVLKTGAAKQMLSEEDEEDEDEVDMPSD